MAIGPGRVDVLGCPLDALDLGATVERCLDLIEHANRPARQVSINAAKLVECAEDEQLRSFVHQSNVISADGQSVVWASRLLGHGLPERVPGIDLMHELLAVAAERSLSIYLLGAREEVLNRALDRIGERYPGLRVAGARNGYFEPWQEPEIAEEIREAGPDLLFLAMNSPFKELWLDRYLERTGVRFAMGVGGAIDVLAGERARAPQWLQRLGLEWAFRLAQEPSRMWRRYLVGNAKFVWLLARELWGRRGRSQVLAW
jgi:N-acetylglucosaminyldiphosphoundecaprenol N-acetyl-beta-D-mannosaminyltransferase